MRAAVNVNVTEESIVLELQDGRTISAPLAWYPRLMHGSVNERNSRRLIGKGQGISRPDLDEDISVESILLGKPSGESRRSLKEWLEKRENRKTYEAE